MDHNTPDDPKSGYPQPTMRRGISKIQTYIRITAPEDGLYYSATCPHGTSGLHFTPAEVDVLLGVEKVCRLAAAHRAQTGCVCVAEDEPAQAAPSASWPWVHAFAHLMEAKMRVNAHKGGRPGWQAMSEDWLFRRAMREAGEVATALQAYEEATSDPERVAEAWALAMECADTANIFMMLADKVVPLDQTVYVAEGADPRGCEWHGRPAC